MIYELTIRHSKYGHDFIIREKTVNDTGNNITHLVMEFYADSYDEKPSCYTLYNEGGCCIIGEILKDTFHKIEHYSLPELEERK